MDPSQNLYGKSQLPPPVYPVNPAVYPPPYLGPSYLQVPNSYSGQPMVSVQPAVFVATADQLVNSVPDYLGYSIFTTLCCCLPLGLAALFFSLNTRNANYARQWDLAERNSKRARILNHVGIGFGIFFILLLIVINIVLFVNEHDMYKRL